MAVPFRKQYTINGCIVQPEFDRGAVMDVQDVNRLIKQFREAQKLRKMIQKSGGRGLLKLFG